MKTANNSKLNLIVLSFIILGMLSRFLPHPPNFTAIGAIALFGGAYFSNRKLALLLPLAILFFSDLILGIISPGFGLHKTIPFVYSSFILITLLGFSIRNKKSILTVTGLSLVSSAVFFIITNFGSWLVFYPHTAAGLTSCYLLAIPFISYNILGDLFFNAIFFGSAYFILQKSSAITAPVND